MFLKRVWLPQESKRLTQIWATLKCQGCGNENVPAPALEVLCITWCVNWMPASTPLGPLKNGAYPVTQKLQIVVT